MFRDVISRDFGAPWPATGMTTARWLLVPLEPVTIADLIATQPGLYFHGLRPDAAEPVGGDPHPHVIAWRGDLYLEDGHHRAVRAVLAGQATIAARVLHVGG